MPRMYILKTEDILYKEIIGMQSIQGIYTGKEIKPLEAIRVRPNARVIITFLDDTFHEPEQHGDNESTQDVVSNSPTHIFLKKCQGWEDTKSTDDTIAEIYTARTTSERSAAIFQKSLS